MLTARSSPECHLYIDLHPCPCGEVAFEERHRIEFGPAGALVAVYDGTCPQCGRSRRFDFVLDPATPPPPPSFGGTTPSRIICPGQFALVAAAAARRAPGNLDGRSPAEIAAGRASMARALAAQEEILKFIPDGADAVPPTAFTSPEGRAFYVSEPGRFDRFRLLAVADSYRETLAGYGPSTRQ